MSLNIENRGLELTIDPSQLQCVDSPAEGRAYLGCLGDDQTDSRNYWIVLVIPRSKLPIRYWHGDKELFSCWIPRHPNAESYKL